MAQRGQRETERLRKNAEDQVTRLMTQLQDLDELRDELTQEEYDSEKAITLQQLEEFNASLKRMMAGDVTLVDSLGSMQLATQAAISQAFKTPEVIKLFALKQPSQLRQRLDQLQRDKTLGKISKAQAQQQGLEVLIALKRLGDKLSEDELAFLQKHMTQSMAQFVAVRDDDMAA